MKSRMQGLFVLAAAIIALVFIASTTAAPHKINAPALPTATAAPVPAASPAEHPEIRDAIASLRRAKEHLEHAAHDFGGHRVEAIRSIDESIHQLEICLKY